MQCWDEPLSEEVDRSFVVFVKPCLFEEAIEFDDVSLNPFSVLLEFVELCLCIEHLACVFKGSFKGLFKLVPEVLFCS
jgi:hypothetical protein